MDLENYTCNKCGRTHETCICFDVEEEFYTYMEYLDREHEKELNIIQEQYPKFKEDEVEVLEGIVVSKEVYKKYYK